MAHVPAFDPSLSIVELDESSGGSIYTAFLRSRTLADQARPIGVHLSTVLNDMLKTLYPKKYAGVSIFTERQMAGYQEIGNICETVIARQLAATYLAWEKPKPRTHRGLVCSPDGWHRPSRTIDEIKCCWVSENEFLDSVKCMTYCWQSLAYAHVWDARRIRLHVLFVNGKYPRGVPAPSPRTFIIRWKDGTPKEKFDMIRQHAVDRHLLAA